jgi:hypothetical protein
VNLGATRQLGVLLVLNLLSLNTFCGLLSKEYFAKGLVLSDKPLQWNVTIRLNLW